MALPKLCPECKHPVADHFSVGCLHGLWCRCPLDLRPPEDHPGGGH